MKCVFCNEIYNENIGCCDKAAMSIALTALRYHVECDHEEVHQAIAQLQNQLIKNS